MPTNMKSHRGALETTVQEYAAASTAHGITYIFEQGRLGIERLFWILMVFLSLVWW